MTTSKAAVHGLDPLKELLGDVLSRLEALESKVGIAASSSAVAGAGSLSASSSHQPVAGAGIVPPKSPSPGKPTVAGEVPAVKAYDAYVKQSFVPLVKSCDDLGGLETMGRSLQEAWEGVRFVIVLASRSKAPAEDVTVALAPYLTQTQEAVKKIRDLKLHRDWDRHYKAVIEMLSCLSWVLLKPPQQLPSAHVKEAIGSADFWLNRIRKDYKGKDEKQIEFCDNIKKALVGLVTYIEEYHKTGLTFNPRGVSLAEAAILLSDEPVEEAEVIKSPVQKRHPTLGNVVAGGNIASIVGELSRRRSTDGSSAATGLKHVTKDQQTWRKEYKGTNGSNLPSAPLLDSAAKKPEAPKKKTPLKGLPIFEYQDRGFKWVVENHTKESAVKEASPDGVITIDITDPKQQVYLYNCEGITVKINGKFKSLILDMCTKCGVVYDTLISSAEVVNCKKIQLQVNGVCPVFTIDKTVNVLVWLSKESVEVSTFTTSLSSEMNVTFPDGEDLKEIPIPEQFVHKLSNGSLSSEVSDLYH